MKLHTLLLPVVLLLSGCAGLSGGGMSETGSSPAKATQSSGSGKSATAKGAGEHKVNFGNWRVECLFTDQRFMTQCKAETYGKLVQSVGDEAYRPIPILWVSWMTGEDTDKRTICVLGHDYPVQVVSFRVDEQSPLQLPAATASGCFIANQDLIDQIRKGKALVVGFQRFPWGETRISFDLHRSNSALDELRRLVLAQ